MFGKDPLFLLDDNGKFKVNELSQFLSKYNFQNFLIFGFTSQIFKYLIQSEVIKKKNLRLTNGILIHGGGWKKLENLKISNNSFKKILKNDYDLKKFIIIMD